MSEEEIVEGNKLIAEFMQSCQLEVGKTSMGLVRNEAKYNSSWDWLMPVCQEISALPALRLPMNGIKDSVTPHIKAMGKMKDGAIRFNIDTTWIGVVEFIKWYNKNK